MNDKKHYFVSDVKFLKLDIPVPHKQMLAEAQALKSRFTTHRGDEKVHMGWKSLALYGLEENRHENWDDEGYTSAIEAAKDFKWTKAAHECPAIMHWLKTQFPCSRFGRVRLMLVEAGGYIAPHSDTTHRILENINIPLSNPKECVWHWGDGEDLHMEPGGVYAMNISYTHSIVNNSKEDRYHLIVARHDSTDEWKTLIENSAKQAGAEWKYILHDIAT